MIKNTIMQTIIVKNNLFSGYGEYLDEYISRFEDMLPDSMSGITENTDKLTDMVGIRGLLDELIKAMSGQRGRVVSFLLLLLGCVILCSVASSISGKIGESVCFGVEIICSVLIFEPLFMIYQSVGSSLSQITEFFGGLIPVIVALTSLGGGASSATVGAGGMYLTAYFVGNVGGALLSSFAAVGLALSLLSSFGGASVILRGVRSIFFWILGILTLIIGAGFSLQTVVASASDGLVIRTAKYMISGLVPVVGNTVSGALSTLTSGLSYAKGIIGPAAVVAIIGMSLSPLVLLLLYRLSLSIASILGDFLGSFAGRLFSAYRFSLDIIISLYSLSTLIYIFEIIVFIRIGSVTV